MAKKRFTDIEIWDREWYMELTPKHKCLIKYLFDKCDASGCWKPNWKLASLQIGENVTAHDLKMLPKDQYEIIPNGKVFIPDFINFQYGSLSKKSPAHNPIFTAIEKNNLSGRVFNRVSDTLKEKDMYKEGVKEEEKEGDGIVVFFKNENFKVNKTEEMIVSEMMKIWKEKNPDYVFSKTTDFTACLKIAYQIGEFEGIDKSEVVNIFDTVNFKEVIILNKWKKIVDFIVKDKFYFDFSIEGISVEKNLQKIYNSIKKSSKPPNGSNKNEKGFIEVPKGIDYDNLKMRQ